MYCSVVSVGWPGLATVSLLAFILASSNRCRDEHGRLARFIENTACNGPNFFVEVNYAGFGGRSVCPETGREPRQRFFFGVTLSSIAGTIAVLLPYSDDLTGTTDRRERTGRCTRSWRVCPRRRRR